MQNLQSLCRKEYVRLFVWQATRLALAADPATRRFGGRKVIESSAFMSVLMKVPCDSLFYTQPAQFETRISKSGDVPTA